MVVIHHFSIFIWLATRVRSAWLDFPAEKERQHLSKSCRAKARKALPHNGANFFLKKPSIKSKLGGLRFDCCAFGALFWILPYELAEQDSKSSQSDASDWSCFNLYEFNCDFLIVFASQWSQFLSKKAKYKIKTRGSALWLLRIWGSILNFAIRASWARFKKQSKWRLWLKLL